MLREVIDPAFRGCIRVQRGDQVLLEHACGYASLIHGIPNTMETRFASASAGKAFVAVGILQLIEKGLLRLEDTLGDVLKMDLCRIDPAVTVRQLLNHTSGVPDYFDESVMTEYEELWRDLPNYRIRRNSDLFPLFLDKPMMYPRGERFQYNNSGYVLLAAILEKATGMPFDVYLQQNVFKPCGMDATGYFELDRLPAGCADHYIFCPETGDHRTNIFSVDAKGTGAGGAYITVGDIVRFWQGLLNGRLLGKPLVDEMMRRQSGDGHDAEEGWYGYGLWILDRPGKADAVYFQGCDPGVSFLSEYDPCSGVISVLASNYGDNVWQAMRRIRQALDCG